MPYLWSNAIAAAAAMLTPQPMAPDILSDPVAPIDPAQADNVGIGEDRARRMTVDVGINDAGPFRFVIDTGAERTVLSSQLVSALALEQDNPATLVSIAGVQRVDTVFVEELTFGKQSQLGIIAPVLLAQNIGADGILGLDSLQKQRVLFDFAQKRISIQTDDKADQNFGHREIVVTARRRSGQLIFTNARIGGMRVNVVIDSGAQISVGNRELLRQLQRRNRTNRGEETDIVSVTGHSIGADIGYVRDFRIGKAGFDNVPVAFADAPPFERLGLSDSPSMLLGMNVLRKFQQVAIDFETRRIHFVLPEDTPIKSGNIIRSSRGSRIPTEM